MDSWILWLVAACVLGVGEMHQGGFYLAPFAAGAALAAVVSLIGVSALLSGVVFIASSAIVFATLRPVARRHQRLPPSIRTGAAALVGRPALVLERIANAEGVGRVKIDGGEGWAARSYDAHAGTDPGARVQAVG